MGYDDFVCSLGRVGIKEENKHQTDQGANNLGHDEPGRGAWCDAGKAVREDAPDRYGWVCERR
jgi:hypothetical protein